MGLKNAYYYLSWIIHYSAVKLLISLLFAVVSRGILTNSNYFLLFLWHYVFGLNLIFIAIFISAFFSKAKSSMIGALIFYLALYLLANNLGAEGLSRTVKMIVSLSP